MGGGKWEGKSEVGSGRSEDRRRETEDGRWEGGSWRLEVGSGEWGVGSRGASSVFHLLFSFLYTGMALLSRILAMLYSLIFSVSLSFPRSQKCLPSCLLFYEAIIRSRCFIHCTQGVFKLIV